MIKCHKRDWNASVNAAICIDLCRMLCVSMCDYSMVYSEMKQFACMNSGSEKII